MSDEEKNKKGGRDVPREVTEAHYLHERSGLEPVLRPPVKHPTALAWIPKREELLACTRDGRLQSVDPVLGTRVIAADMGEAAALAISEDRLKYVAVSREGRWFLGTLKGEVIANGKHEFLGGISTFFSGEYVIMIGDSHDGRYLLVYTVTGNRKGRAKIPKGVVAGLNGAKRVVLARSTQAGLAIIPFPPKKGQSFPKGLDSTNHRLQSTRTRVLGFTSTGICVWTYQGGQPRSMRLPDLTAGDISKDGRFLGLGTRNGAVALARMDRVEKRIHPDLVRAFNSPVTSVAFSDRGKWLATAAEGLRLWSWEE